MHHITYSRVNIIVADGLFLGFLYCNFGYHLRLFLSFFSSLL